MVENHQPLIGDAVFTEGPGLLLVIEKFPGADTLDVTKGLDEAIQALRPGLKGIEVDPTVFRPATYLKRSINDASRAVLIGLGIAVLLIAILLFDRRRALIAVTTIATSVAAAFLVLRLTGTTFSALTIAGLVLGLVIVIDDSIIGAEHVLQDLRRRGRSLNLEGRAALVLEASIRSRGAMGYALIIVLLAMVPLLVLKGISGALIPPTALAFGAAMLASMAVALTVTPALCMLLLPRSPLDRPEPSPLRRFRRGYENGLGRFVRTPGPVLLVLALVIAGAVAVPFLKHSILPPFKERDFVIEVDATPGTSLPEMTRVSGLMSAELRTIPGVRNVGAHVGRAVTGDQVVGVNSGELWISVDPNADYDRTVAAVREVVNGYPGLDLDVLTHSKEQVTEILSGVDAPVVVRVFGTDLDVLRAKAEEVRAVLAATPGVFEPRMEIDVQEPTLEVEVKLDAARRAGIRPGDVRRTAAALISGIEVGSLFEEQKVFDVVVWGAPHIRDSLSSVRALQIEKPDGGRVRLGDVANVRLQPTPTVIKHESVSRSIDIVAGVRGRSAGAVTADVERRLQRIAFPLEYHAEILADHAKSQEARTQLIAFAIAASVGVLLLLQAAFGSWRLAGATFVSLPAALAGGTIAMLIGGRVFSVGSLMGFFALLALAARNAVMFVRQCRAREADGEAFGPELVAAVSGERAAPVLTTTVAVGAAFLPAAVAGPIGGLEVVQPMGIVVIGGVISTALFSLFVLPFLTGRLGTRLDADPTLGLFDAPDPSRDVTLTTRVIVLDPEPAASAPSASLAHESPSEPKNEI